MSKANQTKKEAKIEDPKLQFITVLELNSYYGNIKQTIQSANDIKLVTERQELFNKALEEYRSQLKLDFPEGTTDEEKGRLAQERSNAIIGNESSLRASDVAFFTEDEFLQGIKDMGLTNNQLAFMYRWLVKKEKTDEAAK